MLRFFATLQVTISSAVASATVRPDQRDLADPEVLERRRVVIAARHAESNWVRIA